MVITSTPKKLNTAAIRIAGRTLIARVDTQVAIELGASVHPLTRITANVNNAAINSDGFANDSRIKSPILMSATILLRTLVRVARQTRV